MEIRNFSIIAHIDHGKSTLADRLLEVTQTVDKRHMKEQVLDSMELERERGITIKMTPVRMMYHSKGMVQHSDRGSDADLTQKTAEGDFLYEDLTYKIRGILFNVRKKIGLGHKEQIYHNAIEIELNNEGISFESKKNIHLMYEGKSIGMYQPDFIVDEKILIELKALPEISKPQEEQVWAYLKGCEYKLALLVNFGSKDLEIRRIVYDTARSKNISLLRPSALDQRSSAGVSNQGQDYILNLIDTPGHIDFSYEVSRSLRAVEGTLLLVDSTQGVQAQTLTTLEMAKDSGLTIIPVITKIDSPLAEVDDVKEEIVKLLNCKEEDILAVSGKTGEGVKELIEEIITKVPAPKSEYVTDTGNQTRALIFDFEYSNHMGVILYVRVLDGNVKAGDTLTFLQSKAKFIIREVGTFSPEKREKEIIKAGEIGYIVTGIKEPGIARVGDTVTTFRHLENFCTPM
jgi:GxxExxY protein